MTDLGKIVRSFRERYGWKQYELARRAGISAAQLSFIENNRVSPSFHVVERIAKAFDTDIGGLLSQTKNKTVPSSPRQKISLPSDSDYITLRALESDGLTALAAILDDERQADAVESARGIVNACTIGATSPVFTSAITGATAAEVMRRELGLGTAPVGDLATTLVFRGVRIYRRKLPSASSSVLLWQRERERPVIVLNAVNTPERDVYRLAYELGSVGLYRALGHVIDETLDQHRFLVDFATTFLMPAVSVRLVVAATGLGINDWTMHRLVAIKEYFGVSAESFALRLEELGMIAPSLRLELREQLRAYYRANPTAMEPHPPATTITITSILEVE